MSAALPRVCLVGAGASGIAAARALSKRGIPFDCFDQGDRVGGVWVYGSGSGVSSAYRDLHINVSRERIEFSDLPMPRSYPTFPHHSQLQRYFDDYVHRFGLDRHIRLRTCVEQARRRPDGRWEVLLEGGEHGVYDALVVANGHHAVPRRPDPPPGTFNGEQIHSHDYRDDSVLRDRDVVVVGFGNSACDVAVASSFAARSTHMCLRNGAHVLPKVMFGWPYDQMPGLEYLLGKGIGVGRFGVQIPWRLRQAMLAFGHRAAVGRMEDYGLPKPERPFGAVHPTISPLLLDRLLHGRVVPKPVIEAFEGDVVRFADGSRTRADLVVWCCGYDITFPFLDPALVPIGPANEIDLYWNVFSPSEPGLAFVGVAQPAAGSTMQIAEVQAGWLAAQLAGEYALPSRDEMLVDIARRRRLAAKRYVRSSRHTVQIEQFDFAWRLRGEMRRGRSRARAAGGRLPVSTGAPGLSPAVAGAQEELRAQPEAAL